MEYLGKYGEHLVLANLLRKGKEAYLAIKLNQEDYDITVVLNESCVKRVQVKATDLHNKSTNNSITGTEKDYDYLALVIIDKDMHRVFILTKDEVSRERGNSKKLGVSQIKSGTPVVKDSLVQYEDKWDKIAGN